MKENQDGTWSDKAIYADIVRTFDNADDILRWNSQFGYPYKHRGTYEIVTDKVKKL